MAATSTLVPVAAERCCTTALNGREHFQVQPCQPRPVFLDEALACRVNDVGHLQRWPLHFVGFLRERFVLAASETGSASSGFATACR
jgi:hypothetical protein